MKSQEENQMNEGATPNKGEREFETGTDEFFKSHSELTAANEKRTYDAYQDLDLELARRSQIQSEQIQNIAAQALQNAVETANIVAKQTIRHQDLAADSFWNPVSAGAGMNLTAGSVPANRATDVSAAGVGVSAEAVAAAVAKSVDATIAPVLAILQQIVQALTTATASIANVVNQAQPKTA